MKTSFSFSGIPKFEFGAGKISMLPKITLSYGKNLLLITGNSSFKKSGKLDEVIKLLTAVNIQVFTATVNNEPSPKVVDSIVRSKITNNINVVAAIGGGSVIDTGKAVAAMFREEGSVKDFLEGVGTKTPSGSTLPFIAVPTTSGTGSEATKNAVISEIGKNGFKKSLRHDNYIPKIAILDPQLTLTCPSIVTGASGLDALSQLIESYVSTKATPLTDALAFDGIKSIFKSLIPVTTNDSKNIELRAEMSYASFISGITLAHAGLGTVHGMASVIGGLLEAPHGLICGKLLAAWCKATIKELHKECTLAANRCLDKFINIGRLLLPEENNQNILLNNLIETLFVWEKKLNLPSLCEYGLTDNIIHTIAVQSGNKNNPVNLTNDIKARILTKTLA